jgi:hypothetical protein
MQDFDSFIKSLGHLLDTPWGILIRFAISIVSLGFSIWALKITWFYRASFKAEHERFLEGLWHETYKMTLTDDELAKRVARIFGRQSVAETKDEAALLMFINILSSSYNAARRSVISAQAHESHMKSFFDHYASDSTYLLSQLKELGYDDAFIADCRRFARN